MSRITRPGAQEFEFAPRPPGLTRVAVASDHDRCPLGQPVIVLPLRHTVAARQTDQLLQGLVAQLRIGRVGDRLGLHRRVDHHPFAIAARQRPALVRYRQALLDQRRELALAEPPPPMRQRRAVERQPVAEAQFAAEELVIRVLQLACAQRHVRQPTADRLCVCFKISSPATSRVGDGGRPIARCAHARKAPAEKPPIDLTRQPHQRMTEVDDVLQRRPQQVPLPSSRGFATWAPHADDPPPVVMVRSIRRNQNRQKPPSQTLLSCKLDYCRAPGCPSRSTA